MSDQQMRKKARFWDQDPRFALSGEDHYPVILKEYLADGCYSEDFTEFHGYREQFLLWPSVGEKPCSRGERRGVGNGELPPANRCRNVRDPFKYKVGPRLAAVEEEQGG